MNSSKNNIDIELLRRYYSNDLTNAQRNAIEKRALEDPFLKDAMDGFDANPDSFNAFYAKHKNSLKAKKSYTLLIGFATLLALFGITFLLQNKPLDSNPMADTSRPIDSIAQTTTINSENEYEVIPTAIETLNFIPTNEIISITEIVENQNKNEDPENADPDTAIEDPIIIEENIDPEEDYTIENEDFVNHRYGQKNVETVYLSNLLVIDYRTIPRQKKTITYKRYELGGVSADKEDGNTENQLIETEIKIPYQLYLTKSMAFFADGKSKKALNRFLLILEQYPNDINALFYGGLCYYNLGKHKESIAFFDKILEAEIGNFNQEANWYKAKNLIQLNKTNAANEILDEIIAEGGFYAKDAISLRRR